MAQARASALAVVVALISVAWTGAAEAGRRYAVEIDSEPQGALVFLDDEDGEELGTTPYRGRLEAGTYTLFFRREGYQDSYETIDVRKKRRGRQEFFFDLSEIVYGSVEVIAADGTDDIEGARVLIDGEEIGVAPDTIGNVQIGPHQVEVIKEGHETFEAWIEVLEDETTTVEVELLGGGGNGGGDDDADDDADDDSDDDDDGGDVEDGAVLADGAPRTPFVIASVGPEIGGRKYDYINAQTTNLRPYEAFGVPLLRFAGEVYPLAKAENPFLSGWGLTGSFAKAAPLQSATPSNETIATSWSDWFVGGRFRLALGTAYVGVEGGLGGQTFTFVPEPDGSNADLKREVPDVDYRFLRFGGDVGARINNRFGAYVAFNYRLVNAVGDLMERFRSTEVAAYGGGFGAIVYLNPTWDVRLVGNYNRYNEKFTQTEEFVADGGTDQFFGLLLGLGYTM